jgi:S-formylglutathione hydrolase FrmB
MQAPNLRGMKIQIDTGTHTWPYWQRDLREALPSVLATLQPAST